MTLTEYLRAERGRIARVAQASGLAPAFISQLANGVRGVPAERGAAIEAATDGAVRRWDLRPDDWHRIWPELIGADGAPPVPQLAEEAGGGGIGTHAAHGMRAAPGAPLRNAGGASP